MTLNVRLIDKGGYYMKGFKKLTAGLMGVVMALGVCGFTALAAEPIHVGTAKELDEAVNKYDDITIILDKGIDLKETLEIPNGKNITLDLDRNTLTGPEEPENAFAIQFGEAGDASEKKCENNGRLVIENGTIECNRAVSNYYGEVEFGDDLTVNASDRIMTAFGGKTTVDGAKLKSENHGLFLFNSYYAFGKDGSNSPKGTNASAELIFNSGSVKAENYAISGNNKYSAGTEVTINDGKVIAENTGTAIYWPMEGELNITGGTIKGGTGIEAKMGTINISGGAEIIGTGAHSDDPPTGDGNFVNGAAIFLGSEKYGKNKDQYKESPALKVNIDGGTFTSENGNAVSVYNVEEAGAEDGNGQTTGQTTEVNITDADIDGKLYAIKYYTETETDMDTSVNNGNYSAKKSSTTLKVSGNVAPAAINNPAAINEKGNVVFYSDVNDAVEAANSENIEEVTVFGDIEEDVKLKGDINLIVAPGVKVNADIIAADGQALTVNIREDGTINYGSMDEQYNCKDYNIRISGRDGNRYYGNLELAVADVKNGETIELLFEDCDGKVEVSREVRFTVDANGFDYEIVAGNGYVNTGRGDEYDFITKEDYEDERDSGRHSYSLKEGKTERDDEEEEPVVTPEPEEEEGPFSDVGKDNPNYDAIIEVYEKGWMAGIADGVFAPNGTLTRGMAVTILWNRAGQPEPANVAPFLDVTSDAWYAKAVAWAYENGITSGYGDTYGPDDFLTTEQFTRMNDIANGRTPEVYVGGAPYATRGWVAGMLIME